MRHEERGHQDGRSESPWAEVSEWHTVRPNALLMPQSGISTEGVTSDDAKSGHHGRLYWVSTGHGGAANANFPLLPLYLNPIAAHEISTPTG